MVREQSTQKLVLQINSNNLYAHILYIYIYIYVYVCVCVCVYKYIYIYIYIYICVYILVLSKLTQIPFNGTNFINTRLMQRIFSV